ncbi:MAG: GT2 family glycosyltransferase [Bacteroidia bacterium]
MRAYMKYQALLEVMLPEGTRRRRVLQKYKQIYLGEEASLPPVPATASQHELSGVGNEKQPPRSELLPLNTVTSSQDNEVSWNILPFPTTDKPTTSIIIPVFNNWLFTYACLKSIFDHTQGSYEIIVVDNNSTDVTAQMLSSMQGIRVITNESNEVFVNACNQAADEAKGEYLLFLNNDTEVTAGWIEALLEPFLDPETGIVGAKLIYPDGTLQEAGGIIWTDGSGCNYGHGEDPESPEYCYRKAVDYCSGACLMITQKLWRELGGFDQRYAPAYYEDTDLCFAARDRNYKVIYQPKAQVIHFGGASAGKKTNSGFKRFQDINREKFVDKWRTVLDENHYPGGAHLNRARERNGEKQILVIDHYAPAFDKDSGSLRMLGILEILQEMGYKVFFWPEILAYDAKYTSKLQDIGVEIYYGDRSFKKFIKEHGPNLDAVLLSRPNTAKKYIHLVKHYSSAKTIYDTVDLHFLREQRQADLELRVAEKQVAEKQVAKSRALEFFLANETDATLVVSPVEKEILAKEKFGDKVAVVSNIHSLEPCINAFEDRRGLMFIGGFVHPPNEEGILWFVDNVLPLVREKIRNVHLTIVGSNPTERLKAITNKHITVTGYVEDVSDHFSNSRISISPLLYGAGVKGKIGQSFSFGLPVVTTSIGAEGMNLTDGVNALIADNEVDFANQVIKLYNDKSLWQTLSTNSRKVIEKQFSRATIRAALEQVLGHPRPVILHCHLFKNAGSTLDWSLARSFDSRFMDHRDDESMRQGKSFLGKYIDDHPELSAISSHHVRLPLPKSRRFNVLPIIALRHPIDRIGSVYQYERRQDASTPGAIKAKELSFPDYVRWRMQPDTPPTVRNFHIRFCSNSFGKETGKRQYLDALEQISAIPQLILVDRYDESIVLLENTLAPFFPGIDLSYVRQNVSADRQDSLDKRVATVREGLGEELMSEVCEKNYWDLKLYEDAQAIFAQRFSRVANADALLKDFQSRCRQLAAG